jgi:hypothetical protein
MALFFHSTCTTSFAIQTSETSIFFPLRVPFSEGSRVQLKNGRVSKRSGNEHELGNSRPIPYSLCQRNVAADSGKRPSSNLGARTEYYFVSLVSTAP